MTLIEVVVSTAILGVMFVAGLSAAGAAASLQARSSQHQRAALLASELMEEIMELPFSEPGGASSAIAKESGELTTARTAWDDVDDYDGWSSSPPQGKLGSALMSSSSWTRTATVEHVDPNDLTLVSVTETGVKRITVRVKLNGTVLAQLVAVRTSQWPIGSAS